MSNHRSKENWRIHDIIIDKLKVLLEKEGKYVVANPGQQRNKKGAVARDGEDVYPDLVVRPGIEEMIGELYEIETEDSIDSDEVDQWKLYNSGKSKFSLIVPKGYMTKARKLMRQKGFSATEIGYYDKDYTIYLPE